MEEMVAFLIPAVLGLLLIRLLLLPLKLAAKLAIHSAAGLICLWLLNGVAPFTGILIPVNAVTVAVAGFLGLPGMALMAVLAVMG